MEPKFQSRNTVVLFAAILVMYCQAIVLKGQDRFSIQFRPGVSFATTDFGDADLNAGFGFELSGSYRFMPHVFAYAGRGWNKFPSKNSFAGADNDFEETGYILGLQFIHPFNQKSPLDYFLKTGAIYNHIEVGNSEGEIFADAGHGLGFQVETGIAFRLPGSCLIMPGIKFQTLSRELEIEGITYSVDLNYLSVGATVSKHI